MTCLTAANRRSVFSGAMSSFAIRTPRTRKCNQWANAVIEDITEPARELGITRPGIKPEDVKEVLMCKICYKLGLQCIHVYTSTGNHRFVWFHVADRHPEAEKIVGEWEGAISLSGCSHRVVFPLIFVVICMYTKQLITDDPH